MTKFKSNKRKGLRKPDQTVGQIRDKSSPLEEFDLEKASKFCQWKEDATRAELELMRESDDGKFDEIDFANKELEMEDLKKATAKAKAVEAMHSSIPDFDEDGNLVKPTPTSAFIVRCCMFLCMWSIVAGCFILAAWKNVRSLFCWNKPQREGIIAQASTITIIAAQLMIFARSNDSLSRCATIFTVMAHFTSIYGEEVAEKIDAKSFMSWHVLDTDPVREADVEISEMATFDKKLMYVLANLDDTEAWADSDAANAVMRAFAGIGVLTMVGDKFSEKGFTGLVDGMVKAVREQKNAVVGLTFAIRYFFVNALTTLYGEEFTDCYKSGLQSLAKERDSLVSIMLTHDANQTAPRREELLSFLSRCDVLLGKYKDRQAVASSHVLRMAITSSMIKITELMKKAKAIAAAGKTRPCPFGIDLVGSPGGGKSDLAMYLDQYNHFYMGLEKHRTTAVQNPGSQYHDLLYTWTTGLILDENLQALNAESSKNNPVLDYIQFVNNAPYQYRKADLSGKLGEFCMLISIITTGNEIQVDLSRHVGDPGAYWRRNPRIKVITKPEFCKPGTSILKGDLPRVRGFNPYCTYHFFEMVPKRNKASGVNEYVPSYATKEPVECREAQDMYDKMLDAHIEKELSGIESAELLSKQSCPQCGRMPHLCKCFFGDGISSLTPVTVEMTLARTCVSYFKSATSMHARSMKYHPLYGIDGVVRTFVAPGAIESDYVMGRRKFNTSEEITLQYAMLSAMSPIMKNYPSSLVNRCDMNTSIDLNGKVIVKNTARKEDAFLTHVMRTCYMKGILHNELSRMRYAVKGPNKPHTSGITAFIDGDKSSTARRHQIALRSKRNEGVKSMLDRVGTRFPSVLKYWVTKTPAFQYVPPVIREAFRPVQAVDVPTGTVIVRSEPIYEDTAPEPEEWPTWMRPVKKYKNNRKRLFQNLGRESGVNYFMWLMQLMSEGGISTPQRVSTEARKVGMIFKLYDHYPASIDPLAIAHCMGVDVTKYEIFKQVLYACLRPSWHEQAINFVIDNDWIVVGCGFWRHNEPSSTITREAETSTDTGIDYLWTKVDSTIASVFPVMAGPAVNTLAFGATIVSLTSSICIAPIIPSLAIAIGTGSVVKGVLDRVNVDKIGTPEKVAGTTSALLVAGGLVAVVFAMLAYLLPLIPDQVFREAAKGASNVWAKPDDIRVKLSEKVKTSLKDPVIKKFRNNGFSITSTGADGKMIAKCNGFSVDHNYIIVPVEVFMVENKSWFGKSESCMAEVVELDIYFRNTNNAIQRVKKKVRYDETVGCNVQHRLVRCTTFGARASLIPYFPESIPRGETKLSLYSFRGGVFTQAGAGLGTIALTDVFGDGKANTWMIRAVDVGTQAGDCGGVWIADYGKNGYVGGLHLGKQLSRGGQTAFAEVITRADVQNSIEVLRDMFPGTPGVFESSPPCDNRIGVEMPLPQEIHPKHTINYMPMESAAVITGQYGDGKKERNRMEQSPMHTIRDDMLEKPFNKSPATFERRHLGDAIRNAARGSPRADQRALSQAYIAYISTWKKKSLSTPRSRSSIFNREEVERKLNASTSTGPPYNMAKWKILLWSDDQDRYLIPDELWDLGEQVLLRIKARCHSGSWHSSCFKEELRSVGKDTRVIYPAALIGLILKLRYFGPLLEEMNEHGLDFGLATGLDPQSTDAQDMLTSISSLGGWNKNRIIATDFKGYDTSLLNELKSTGGSAFVEIDSQLFESSKEELEIKETLMQEIACPEVEVRGVIVQLPDMIASGDLFTNAMDGVCGQLLLRYVFFLNRSNNRVTSFDEEVAAISMGDDMIGEVAVGSNFDCVEFKKGASTLGIIVTGPDKDDVKPYYNSKVADFLKRRFVNHDGVRRVVMALDPEAILNSFTYMIPSSKVSQSTQILGTARSAMELAWPNGKVFYNKLQKEVVTRLETLNEPVPIEVAELYEVKVARLRSPIGKFATNVYSSDPWQYELRNDVFGLFWARVRGDIPWREADFHQQEGVETPEVVAIGQQSVMQPGLGSDIDSDPIAWYKRPALVDERAIIPEAELAIDLDVLSLWLERPEVKERMQYQGMMRFEMEVTVEAYAPPQSSGAFMISFLPLGPMEHSSFIDRNLVLDSQSPTGVVRLGDDEPVTIKIPFVWFQDAMNLLDGSHSLYGRLRIQTLARMRETVVTGHQSRMLITVRMTDLAMGQSTIERHALSDYLQGAANVARSISGMPIGQWATVASIASSVGDGMASVARKHGFSRPNVTESMTPVVERPLGSMAAGDAPDMCVTLAHTSLNATSIDPRIVGATVDDEMSIGHIASRWSYLSDFDFATTNVNGDVLFQIGVTPVVANKESNGWALPACSAAVAPFGFSNFTMEYMIVPVATAYHNGQIQVNYDPVSSTTTSSRNIVQNAAIQVSESRAGVIITVEWNNNKPLLHHDIYHDNFGDTVVFDDHMNGVLSFLVVNPLMSMRANDRIKVLVFIRCKEVFVMQTDDANLANLMNGTPPSDEGFYSSPPPTPGNGNGGDSGDEPPLGPESVDFNPSSCGDENPFLGMIREQFIPMQAIKDYDAVVEESPFASELVAFKRIKYMRVPVTVLAGQATWLLFKVKNVGGTVKVSIGIEGCSSVEMTTLPEVIAIQVDPVVDYDGPPVQLVSITVYAPIGDLIIDGYWVEWHPEAEFRLWTTRTLDATMPMISGSPLVLPMVGYNERNSLRGWTDQAQLTYPTGEVLFPPVIWGHGEITIRSEADGKQIVLDNRGTGPTQSPGPESVRPWDIPFNATAPSYNTSIDIVTTLPGTAIASVAIWSRTSTRRRMNVFRRTTGYPLLTSGFPIRNCRFEETTLEGLESLRKLIDVISRRGTPLLEGPIREAISFGGNKIPRQDLALLFAGEDLLSFRLLLKKSYPLLINSPIGSFTSSFFPLVGSRHIDDHSLFAYVCSMFVGVRGGIRVKALSPGGNLTGYLDDGDPRYISRNLHMNAGSIALDFPYYHSRNFLHARASDPYDSEAHNFVITNPTGIGNIFYAASESFNLSFFVGLPLIRPRGEFSAP